MKTSDFSIMEMKANYQLNRAWIFDECGCCAVPIGETNFVISAEYLFSILPELFELGAEDFEDFLDCYEPEFHGEMIYQQAVQDGQIIDEFESLIDYNDSEFE